MRLIALLAVLVLTGLVMGRMGGGPTLQQRPSATAGQTTRQVEQATGAASQAERQRLDEAMKALR